jgi:hypothetical protein
MKPASFEPVMTILLASLVLAILSEATPAIPPSCNLTATASWPSAGEGYRAQAMTEGETCDAASLSLALVSPSGRALFERAYGGVGAVRRFYGVPGPAEMQIELESWIAPADGKPAVTTALPDWATGSAAPLGFEPAEGLTAEAWANLREAARPVFCFDEDPGYQTCLVLDANQDVTEIGRRATR